MRHRRVAGHIHTLIWGFVVLALIGVAFDAFSWVMLIGVSCYLFWTIRQGLRFHKWLYSDNATEEIPESYGLWGDLFEGLHRLQRENRDVQLRLKHMINRVRVSTNALKEAVIMTNGRGDMEWWNDAAARLFGFREDSDRGQLITNLVRDPRFKKYFDDKHYEDALEMSSPLNRALKLRIYITLFGDEDRLVMAQDVSRIYRLEQMRQDFVSNVSHEMRTPLTVIRGYIETLQDADDTPKKWQRPLAAMEDQSRRLEMLISDLLLLEKVKTHDLQSTKTQVNVDKLLQMICHDAAVLSDKKQHTINIKSQSEVSLLGDEAQLRSAFSNLIFNAVKYTPDQGTITVSAWVDGAGLHVSVKDTGCGFDPVHIPRLTERFYRADPSRHADTGGSGLGLAIVKHVLINHQATLEIHSAVGQGSEFICHFPLHNVQVKQELEASNEA